MDTTRLLELIKTRRAVMPTQYSDQEITSEELNHILESANWAPTHKRTEPWRFKVIQGDARNRFAEFMIDTYKENTAIEKQSERTIQVLTEKCLRSDKIILICVKKSGMLPEWEEVAATAMAVQNMWLMCTSMGIGSYWSSPSAIKKMNEFTELEENEECYGIFYMGKQEGELFKGTRMPMEPKVQYIG
jgi:nitroreductase